MNESKHTPGPWAIWQLERSSDAQERYIVVTDNGGMEVCGIIESEADALLMAAAPDLLAACTAVRHQLETGEAGEGDVRDIAWCVKALADAIAKAEG